MSPTPSPAPPRRLAQAFLLAAVVVAIGSLLALAFGPAKVGGAVLAAGVVAVLGGMGLVLGLRTRAADDAPAPEAKAPAPAPAPVLARPAAPPAGELERELERHRALERELRQAKQDAEAATMAKGEFLATMSHEIRTPLNGIIPLLDILLSTPLQPDQRDYLVTAYQSAKQLLSIVDDILDYSKIEANKLELETVGINLKEIVDSVTRLMARNAEAKNLRFTATIDPNVRLAMRGDPVRLRQVLTNLVSNAIKFTERGQVAIDVKKRSETRTHADLLFTVRDTGIGIEPDTQARLFKPFAQADASTTRIHGGTGLGLVICKRIVDLMGGQIGVRSEPGKGSTFWFSVPMLKAVGDVTPARTDLHGARAVVVTTDTALLRRVTGWFTNWGVSAVQTSVSAEALAKLRAAANSESFAFDFLVLDFSAMKNSATSLARNVAKDGGLERVKQLALLGEEELAAELRGQPRITALPRAAGEAELRGAMQRLLEGAAAEGGAAPAESLIAPLPSLPVDEATATPSALGAGAPVRTPIEVPAPGAGPAAAPVGGHVLLVEDNAVNRQVAQRLLSLVGVSFDLAEHGKQALERLEAGRYDAVLMDCQMPVMDGYSATRAIRKLESDGVRATRIPIIAMTANAMAGDREKCLACGMDDYMSKPLNRALLEQTLRKHLPATARAVPAAAPAAPAPRAAPAPVPTPAPHAAPVRAPAATAQAGRERAAIDEEIVRDLIEVMGGEFTDLVRVYLEDTPKSISALEDAARRGDVDGLIAPAHSLKSTSANLGALELAERAKQIEHGARTQKLPGEPVMLVAELAAEYRRAAEALRKLLSASAA